MSTKLYTADGYPSEEALERLASFNGTAQGATDYIRSLMRNGGSKVETYVDDFGRERKRLTLITGGWSGCESVISVLHDTMFHLVFWESSFRGGMFTYTFSEKQWDMETNWGKVGA